MSLACSGDDVGRVGGTGAASGGGAAVAAGRALAGAPAPHH